MRIPLLEKDDAYEFKPLLAEIEERPVSPMGRFIMLMIINTMIFFGAWMYFGQIDIVVSGRGTVIPSGENKVIQPLDIGVVSKILVSEGEFVRRGQTLVEIDPSTTQPELRSADENFRHARMEIRRIHATLGVSGNLGAGEPPASLRTGDPIERSEIGERRRRVLRGTVWNSSLDATQRSLYEAAINGLNKQIAAKEAELRSLDAQIEHSKIEQVKNGDLLKVAREKEARMAPVQDILAQDEIDKVKNDIVAYSNSIRQEEQKVQELQHRQAQIREEMQKIKHEFNETQLKELNDKEKIATELEAKLKELSFKNAKQVIVSPVDGHVDQLFVHTVGGVVSSAEKLMSIVPAQMPLVVKASIENQDVGFIATGQPVSIKVDTFEFQKYGMFDGKVKLISKDSHDDEGKKEQGKFFDVYVTPITKTLKVEGRDEPLKPGMTVTAEIKVGKRRIIEFFIYPIIKYWNEGMSVR